MGFKSKETILELGKIVKHPSGKTVKLVMYSFYPNALGKMETCVFWKEVSNKRNKKLRGGKPWN